MLAYEKIKKMLILFLLGAVFIYLITLLSVSD